MAILPARPRPAWQSGQVRHDLETVLRDAVVPTLPFQPVCRDDCPGLCAQCGLHLAEDPDHHHEVIDPRWSALSGLLQDDPQEKRN